MQTNYFNYNSENLRSIPFLSPALAIDSNGKQLACIDERISNIRKVLIYSSSLLTGLGTLLILSAAPLTFCLITIGVVALSALGFKLDEDWTYQAATKLAIEKYLNNAVVPEDVISWLCTKERIQSLLENENIDLRKKDTSGRSLIDHAFENDNLEIFLMLWDRFSYDDKTNIFIRCVENTKNNGHPQIVDFLIDNKKVNVGMFSEKEQHYLLNLGNDQNLKRFLDFGFNINVSYEGKKSLLEAMSENIFTLLLDKNSFFNIYKAPLPQMNLLQEYFEKRKWGSLTNLKNENQLEVLAPFLKPSKELIIKAFSYYDNVKIGRILWDKADDEQKKEAFLENFDRDYPKLAISLLEDKKVSPDLFTEKEQFNLFDLCLPKSESFQHLNKFLELGFNLNSKNNLDISILNRFAKSIFEYLLEIKNLGVCTGSSLDEMNFFRKYLEKNISLSLALSHKDKNSSFNLLPSHLLMSIMNLVKDSNQQDFDNTELEVQPFINNQFSRAPLRKKMKDELILKPIASYVLSNQKILIKAAQVDDEKIGRIFWEKASNEERKLAFMQCFNYNPNSKLALSLMHDKKVIARMFTENEQFKIFNSNLIILRSSSSYEGAECLEKLVEIGFNIEAKCPMGMRVKQLLNIFLDRSKSLGVLQKLKAYDNAFYKQMIRLGLVLESGNQDETSNLSLLPKDVVNNIFKAMISSNI